MDQINIEPTWIDNDADGELLAICNDIWDKFFTQTSTVHWVQRDEQAMYIVLAQRAQEQLHRLYPIADEEILELDEKLTCIQFLLTPSEKWERGTPAFKLWGRA